MEKSTQAGLLIHDPAVSTGKPIPRMPLIPREVSLNHLVSRAIPAFDTYGDVFKLGLPLPLNVFCLRNPDHIKAVTSQKNCGTMKPGHTIPKADFFMGNGVYNDLGGATWMAKRRMLAPTFTDSMSVHFSESLPAAFERMKSRWMQNGTTSQIDLYEELLRLVLDFAAAALFSEELGAERLDWIVPATNFAEMMFVTLTPYWIPSPSNLKFRRIRRTYHKLMEDIIAKHRARPGAYKDMVSHLTDVAGNPHTDEEIKAEMFSSYLGTPAMSLTILWGVYILATRPDILAKLREELNRVIGDRLPRAEDLTKLPYLEMFVKEVLRLYPSFWGSLRYSKDAMEIDGYSFPKRSIFAMVRVAAQRLPNHWENPDQFIPERHAKRNACPHALLPFGLGPRMCLGRSLATILCPLAIASIAQSFNVHLRSNEIKLKYGFGMYPAETMFATVQPARL
jgi:cytochrome P450